MAMQSSLHVVVLAAGAATRFGSPKQLAPVNGVPMLRLVIGRALSLAGAHVSVVLGAHAAQVAPALGRLPVSVVANRGWEEGLAASIRAGLAHVPGSAGGVLLLLGDQVGVTRSDLGRMADAWRRSPQAIIAAQPAGDHGLPALFPRSQFGALRALRGERGVRALLRGGERVIGLSMAGAAVDIDTREQLASYEALLENEARERETGETWRGPALRLPDDAGGLGLGA